MSANWIKKSEVVEGTLCTAQAVIKHLADVGIAVWVFVIAVTTVSKLWSPLCEPHPDHKIFGRPVAHRVVTKWATFTSAWLFVIVMIVLGVAVANVQEHGPYYGVSGDLCWITNNYVLEKVFFAYLIMFSSAFVSSSVCAWTLLHLRRKYRTEKPSSQFIVSEQDQLDEYEVVLVKHMILYPFTYSVCIFPIAVVRFIGWSNKTIPEGAIVFADFVYLLFGIIVVIIFLRSPRVLPPRTYLPGWFVSDIRLPRLNDQELPRTGTTYEDPYYAEGGEKHSARVVDLSSHASCLAMTARGSCIPSRPGSYAQPPPLRYPMRVHAPENPFSRPLYARCERVPVYFSDRCVESPISAAAFCKRSTGLPTGPRAFLHPTAMDREDRPMDRTHSSSTEHERMAGRERRAELRLSTISSRSSLSVRSMNKPLPNWPKLGLPSSPSENLRRKAMIGGTRPSTSLGTHSCSVSATGLTERSSTMSFTTASSFSPMQMYAYTPTDNRHLASHDITRSTSRASSRPPSRTASEPRGYMRNVQCGIRRLQTEGADDDDDGVSDVDGTERPRSSQSGETIGAFQIVTRPESYIPLKRAA
ncbi:hypothetical protein K488DRAFT_88794 [Vararia minispora EC-137]|uniref:Uncharacterized protein n=1 Tax=Vararia minispora EC-137 TaxID=1314806 RepID=A0ACB8QCR2_9AGAM|nr:hypothetical protein K488DRAFT_88794 [Vararia minispora EC-137]